MTHSGPRSSSQASDHAHAKRRKRCYRPSSTISLHAQLGRPQASSKTWKSVNRESLEMLLLRTTRPKRVPMHRTISPALSTTVMAATMSKHRPAPSCQSCPYALTPVQRRRARIGSTANAIPPDPFHPTQGRILSGAPILTNSWKFSILATLEMQRVAQVCCTRPPLQTI